VYIADPSGATSLYRVRLGPFKSKGEADVAAVKFKKEMGVTPWVTP
jgi:cell division protein FtsN